MTIEKVNINEIKPNPSNPRTIRDEKFKKLVKSIEEYPEMLEIRPIVVDDSMTVLGGNMRLKACKEAGLNEIPIIILKDIDDKRKKEFLIKDNIHYGSWDYLLLKDFDILAEWGMDIPYWAIKEGDEGDDFFDDFAEDESPSGEYEEPEKTILNSSNTTFYLLMLTPDEYEFIKKIESNILSKTGKDNISDALYEIIKND